jgi:hypothetical protein
MTELLAALLGAIVGGVLSAWVGSRQTAKVLKHETEMAATERREALRLDEQRRQSFAADQLIAALAGFTTVKRNDRDGSASFVRIPATADVHRERDARASGLLQAGSSHAHALPDEVRKRWSALTWMVRFNQSEQPDRSEGLRRRDASDLLNYVEYLRRSLCAVAGGDQMPPHFPPPDMRRADGRPWGFKPAEGCDEPDLTHWHLQTQLVGTVKLSTGETKWYGPNGWVEILPQDAVHPEHSDTD